MHLDQKRVSKIEQEICTCIKSSRSICVTGIDKYVLSSYLVKSSFCFLNVHIIMVLTTSHVGRRYDFISSWSLLIFLLCISELLWLCRVVALKSLPVHSFNALIIPILRGCLQSLFNIPVPWYLFDTVLKVTSWPAFVSRCIIDAYFSFYGLVLDIDMNCGCRLYRYFWQMDLTYAMDCLLNYNRYECRFSLDGITTLHTTMTITNRLK